MRWGGLPERQPPHFVCHSLEKMDTNGYLCYTDSQSLGIGSQTGDTCVYAPPLASPWAIGDSLLWYLPEFTSEQFHADRFSTPCLTESSQPGATNVQVPICPQEPNRHDVYSALPTVLFIAIELILLYAAYRIGLYSGLIRRGIMKRAKGKLMKILAVEKSSDSVQSILPNAAVESVPVSPVSISYSNTQREEEESRLENSLPEKAVSIPKENPAKVAWENFLCVFRNRKAHEPFPAIKVEPDIPEDVVDSLLVDDEIGVKNLLADCRDSAKRREIAREFCSRFPMPESEWGEASVLMAADEDTTYWVAGDIHAKVSAIAKICAVISDRHRRGLTKERNVLILLGDYVDRGDEPLETLAFIECLKLKPLFGGFKVITLKGNHDVGLSRDVDGKYVSMVSPAETAEFFRSCVERGDDVSLEADAAMRLAAISPRMCELTGIDLNDPSRTMLFVHGGVPHVDLQEKLYDEAHGKIPQKEPFFKALACDCVSEELRKSCAEDFTWIRLSKDLPVKQPNRGSRGCEIGTEDVSQYLFLHRALTTRDITFIFRGHDHERSGFACYSPHDELNPTKKKFVQRECNVLTLNAMEPDYSSSGMFRERDLALAEWSLGNPVQLHRIITHHLEVAKPIASVSDEIVSPSSSQPVCRVPSITSPEELTQGSQQLSSAQNAHEDMKVEEKNEIL